ncbi:hypothetical protein ABI59_09470 [Acidobacteria bacterium Mor1]|nr:hypothetical protein ABI59_09470 [Acidobacteria bacterium Mor1]
MEQALQSLRSEGEQATSRPAVVVENTEHATQEIRQHVLYFKPVLRQLFEAIRADRTAEFTSHRWRELTPSAFAAALIASSGLVRGIGVDSYSPDTHTRASFWETHEAIRHQLAPVQLMTWAALSSEPCTPDETLSERLSTHINPFQLPRVVEHMESLAKKSLDSPEFSWLQRYATLATAVSSIANAGKETELRVPWALYFLEFEILLRDPDAAPLQPLQLSPHQVNRTIGDVELWNAITHKISTALETTDRELSPSPEELIASVLEVGTRLSRSQLVEDTLASIRVSFSGTATEDFVLGYTTRLLKPRVDPSGLGSILKWLSHAVLERRGAELIEKIAARAIARYPGDRRYEATVDAWYGEMMKVLRHPSAYLERVGSFPRPWEAALPFALQVSLENERSNSLRILGEKKEALERTEQIIARFDSQDKSLLEQLDGDRRILERNRAILLRETGRVDAAIPLMLGLLESAPLREKHDLLTSLGVSYGEAGRFAEAASSFKEALDVAPQDPRLTHRAKLHLAQALIADGQHTLAATLILGSDPGEVQTPETTVIEAAVWTNLLVTKTSLPAEAQEQANRSLRVALDLAESPEIKKDYAAYLGLLELAFTIKLLTKDPTAEESLRLLLAHSGAKHRTPEPKYLADLASIQYRKKDLEQARATMSRIPGALASHFGEIQRTDIAAGSTTQLSWSLEHLGSAVTEDECKWPDVRWVAELSRDAIGLARTHRQPRKEATATTIEGPIPDSALVPLAPAHGTLLVLEWIHTSSGLRAMLSSISHDENVETQLLPDPGVDLLSLQQRILSRLNFWFGSRPGDPFDIPEWQRIRDWLCKAACAFEPPIHLVVIEHRVGVGIPWHVAIAAHGTCSYAPSWRTLLQIQQNERTAPESLGTMSVPRFGESRPIREALSKSATRTKKWATTTRIDLTTHNDIEGTKDSFRAIMSEMDVAKVACHGYLEEGTLEIALALSSKGALPPLRGSMTSSDFRLDWKDCQGLSRSSPVVFSSACSSGRTWRRGAGEPLGFYGALRHSGTVALVAPRWDTDAEVVIPILDEACERYCSGEPLADSVWLACSGAAQEHDDWRVWPLAIQGDWR